MNTNVNSFNDKPIDKLQVGVNIAYMITGGLSATTNLLLITTLLIFKKFRRKELLMLVGLAIGDFLYGIGFLLGGARRLYLVLHNLHTTLVSTWDCQIQPATFFYVFGPQVSSLMEVSISLDRFIAVSWPAVYQVLTVRYVITIICTILGFVTISYCTGLVLAATMNRTPEVAALCLSTKASWPSYGVYYTLLIAVGYVVSIVIYGGVMIVLRYRTIQIADDNARSNMYNIQHKRQLKITRMLGMSSVATFVLCVIPWIVQMSVSAHPLPAGISEVVQPLTWVCIQSHGAFSVSIYLWKLKDLRAAFRELLRCKVHSNQVSVATAGITHGHT